MKDGKFITLGIETSCDETSVAILADGRDILSNVISSQIDIHIKYGGVVPEIASRKHLENINHVLDRALSDAEIKLSEVDLIGVTMGPGLIGAVVIGVATAKALSLATGIPLVGVNHMHGHISANYIQYKNLEPPFLALVISGGHTNIVKVTDYNKCEILGETRDDAVGETYDKVARAIGLGYPGGPKIDKAANNGNSDYVKFKRVYLEKDSLDFSFSGLKTQVLNYINKEKMSGREIRIEDVSASFQQAVLDVIVNKSISAVEKYKMSQLVVAGGVAANSKLREMLSEECKEKNISLYIPDTILCTDNAAMIGVAAYYKFKYQGPDNLSLDGYANLAM